MNLVAIDFEFKGTNEAKLDLVCCALSVDDQLEEYWLYRTPSTYKALKNRLLRLRENSIILAFNVDAEARSFIALNLNPARFKWFDIQAEYKMIVNHNHNYMYGKQLINGVEVTTCYKNYFGPSRGHLRHDNPEKSLVACTYKMLEEKNNLEYKDRMRDLILTTLVYTDKQKAEIMKYCASDVKDLFRLRKSIIRAYQGTPAWKYKETLLDEILYRGETVARGAIISSTGYPVHPEKVRSFTASVANIIKECQEDINEQFRDNPPFVWIKREGRYSVKQQVQYDWIEQSEYREKWERTETNRYSLSLDAYEKFFSYRHDYPRGNFPAQIIRYYKLRQSLNGFIPRGKSGGKRNRSFNDSYGSDFRAHPYLNSYGSQTSRYQPQSTGFIPLKAAWMRSLIEPSPGSAICGIDYSSQEFLIAALLSNDENMVKAYESGDVYLYFAKLAGAVPWDGTKKQYKLERDRFKATTLAIQYGMMKKSLALKLTNDTGIKHTEEEAQDLIDKFGVAYATYDNWRDQQLAYYKSHRYLRLRDGWMLFGDNENERSVLNFPVQGTGAAILRKAIQLCQDAGLKVIIPLHDALYIEYPSNQWEDVQTFMKLMKEAFVFTMDHDKASLIGLDTYTWSPDYEEGFQEIGNEKIKTSKLYIDERAKADYDRFSKYFIN
jgi:hypothetical protein